MLQRIGFGRYEIVKPPRSPAKPVARRSVYARMDVVVPVPKEIAIQHQGYMHIVRGFPCIRCGHAPRSQFCHADEGKGMAIKTDCRLGWPGCAFCHHLIGTSGTFDRETKRRMERDYGTRTREKVLLGGLWPKGLERWKT